MVASHPMIVLRNLYRFFGATKAVNGITFEVPRGQVFGYIGPNGAGKTTSMRILATLDLPTAGDAFVDGFSVVDDPDRVRRRLGFMPDYFGTYANVNVREYLDFFARAYGLRGGERQGALRRVMGFTGLDVLSEKPINGLSKGMKQRLCLGRAIIHDPAVLILDEPAAGLDPRARIQLREMIRELAAEGKSILVSSHILGELAEMCDLVGIVELGRLLAVGSVAEIQQKQQQHTALLLQVCVLDDPTTAANFLQAQAGVRDVRIDGDAVTCLHEHDDRAARAALLTGLVGAGIRVESFGVRTTSLEDVFLQVTEGRVQ